MKVSDANHWMKCHGSVKAQAQFPALPGEVSESRLEGRACHEVAQKMFAAFRGGSDAPLFSDLVGSVSADGIVVTQELFDAAREYVNEVVGYCNANGQIGSLHVEERTDLSHIIPDWYGIPDAWVWDPETRVLAVWDAKFGHRFVDAFENWPMLLYVSGILNQIGLSDHERQFIGIRMTIVQPRGFHSGDIVRTWSIGYLEFTKYLQQLTDAIADVQCESPTCVVGSHCTTCSARAHCDTLKTAAYEGMDAIGQLATHDLHGHALGVELRLLRRAAAALDARLSGLEEQAIHEIKAGKPVTFFGTKQGYGRERWKKETPHSEVVMMGDLMGVDLRKPVELDTPAQARKKGVDESVIAAYTEIPMTALKLVEVDGTEARQVFTRNEG